MTQETTPIWAVMPAMANPDMTEAAIADLLAQSVPVKVLLILQGVAGPFRQRMELIAEHEPRLLVWVHDPPLPSLSATWNRALQAVWEAGGEEALVVNNDVRLHKGMLQCLLRVLRHDALFVTAVGVTKEQFEEAIPEAYDEYLWASAYHDGPMYPKGGPDFSCFLISKAGHQRYPFDEQLIPSHCEDLDLHRRMMLGGDGSRIFSINLPYLHIGGGANTLKSMSPDQRTQFESRIGQARAYYARKWNGPVNGERLTIPFDLSTDQAGVTTPDLQRMVQEGEGVHVLIGDDKSIATPDSPA